MDLTGTGVTSLQRRPPSAVLASFADEVGSPDAGPVACVGGRTQWGVGGAVDPGAREVRAPSGIVQHEPAELTVRCLAGTTVAELDRALARHGQRVALPAPTEASTVGGVLAVGHGGVRRLGDGPVRDTVLEVRYVSAEGRLVKGGGPVVKNVSGFDLCRLMVGSLGTLGFLGEVVLRCRPRPASSRWYRSRDVDPFEVRARLFRPVSILWDGTTTWVLLEGTLADVEAEVATVLGASFEEVEGPPPVPDGGRESRRPSELRSLTGDGWLAEIGVGVVHRAPVPARALEPATAALGRRVKAIFDPTGRLNPGRQP